MLAIWFVILAGIKTVFEKTIFSDRLEKEDYRTKARLYILFPGLVGYGIYFRILKKFLDDPDDTIRLEAEEAIKRITKRLTAQ
tara:strand:- start:123 stop:371 length:249 start_codon:yes stop_codon:yes gene_type:complete